MIGTDSKMRLINTDVCNSGRWGETMNTENNNEVEERKLEKIIFKPDGADPVEFFVLEQTRLGGYNYILVTDFEEGDGEALILKDVSEEGEEESRYVIVSDDAELDALAPVFEDLLDDVSLERDPEDE
jgi:hypothetical protein